MHRLLMICNHIDRMGEIGEFELRQKFGLSRSLYIQVKSDLLNAVAFKWRVEFNKTRKTWRYIGHKIEEEQRKAKADARQED